MNLKRIKDNLYINSEKWIYTPITAEFKDFYLPQYSIDSMSRNKTSESQTSEFFYFLISEVFQK